MPKHLGVVLAAALVASCAQVPPEMRVVDAAAKALGGKDRVLAVKSLVIEGEGTNGWLGQSRRPDADSLQYDVTGLRRQVDLVNGRARQEQLRTANFLTGTFLAGVTPPQRQEFGVDGIVGYNIARSGATRIADQAARERRAELVLHHPLGALRAALDPGARLTNPRTHENRDVVEIATALGDRVTLAIDSTTKLPVSVTSMAYDPLLGDLAVETKFSDYEEVNGVRLPKRLTSKIDRFSMADIRVTRQTVDGEIGDLSAPEAVRVAAPPAPRANVTVEEVAKGVWFLAGQGAHSVLVEFADHLTLIEAPQDETRALAVIAKSRELRPEKPLTHVVVTHHHFDHAGGLRAAIAEGLIIVTHKSNEAFFREVAERKHTIAQDSLAKNPKPLKIETFEAEHALKDASMEVNLYHVAGNPHGETLLMAHLPRERILVQGDLYYSGAVTYPFLANMLEHVEKRKLLVDKHLSLHGEIRPHSEVLKAAQTASGTKG